MIKYCIQIGILYIKDHMDSIAAFTSGSVLTLSYWVAIDPTVVVDKILMSALLGAAGGFGGLFAKAVCNHVALYLKERKRRKKNSSS